jgi:uncharacterized protein
MVKLILTPTPGIFTPSIFQTVKILTTKTTALCVELVEEKILPAVNLFCYGQVRSGLGPQFLDELEKNRER